MTTILERQWLVCHLVAPSDKDMMEPHLPHNIVPTSTNAPEGATHWQCGKAKQHPTAVWQQGANGSKGIQETQNVTYLPWLLVIKFHPLCHDGLQAIFHEL
jgi:hypothetical protein